MGLYGCISFAYSHGLVKKQAFVMPPGVLTPVAVDIWNVMYTLMEKFYSRQVDCDDSALLNVKCLYMVLRLLHKRSCYPIFVSDRAYYFNKKGCKGAKAIFASTMAAEGGTGRLGRFEASLDVWLDDEDEALETACKDEGAIISNGELAPVGTDCQSDECVQEGDVCQEYEIMPSLVNDLNNDTSYKQGRIVTQKPKRYGTRPDMPKLNHGICMSIIKMLGFPYVDARSMEADDVCANLFHTKTVPYVYSNDGDLLLMGCDVILDMSQIFPPTLRCKDILNEMGIDYATFLAKFVRCHTDLHRYPILKSVHAVLHDINPTHCDGNIETMAERSETSAQKSSSDKAINCDRSVYIHSSSQKKLEKYESARSCSNWRKPVIINDPEFDDDQNMDENRRPIDIVAEVRAALDMMPVPRTRHEVLEVKFIRHVMSLVTPRQYGPHLKLLKRIQITQDERNDESLLDFLYSVLAQKDAEELSRLILNRIPPPQDYRTVLIKYWD
ncbi:UL41 [anatid alphaherpesvirus 1]|uniref:Virion host shutoff protein n=1 Tax=anatid alphaherpesvirus 1 TaxID=104388 RepID=B6E8Z3_9ALPH|nr:UL41 [Anatid alphaherpesvirus 1]AHD45940.1 UL41 [BAC cloning vector pDEV-vac]QWQ49765.1 UL41 [BAC cloning vector pDEV-CHa]ACI26684.1 UL41 [Anatid alphaherpesvirus 1]ACN30262.1 UL41 [Anatid alphaherpesvirus 1]ACT83533.1 UL41 [Anatid alphaherpesvirus 1]